MPINYNDGIVRDCSPLGAKLNWVRRKEAVVPVTGKAIDSCVGDNLPPAELVPSERAKVKYNSKTPL